jgi:glutaminyl-peptide cyclotransferase
MIQYQLHTKQTFTQGLCFSDGHLYESSGIYGKSYVQKYLSATKVSRVYFPKDVFVEGITVMRDKVYVVSWHAPILFIFDTDLKFLERFNLDLKEAWGLTNDGFSLILTDGSNEIVYLSPVTLKIEKRVSTPLQNLNDIQYKNGSFWVNVWKSDIIYKLSYSGDIIYSIDTSQMPLMDKSEGENVLNGITVHSNKLIFTGKNWKNIYFLSL